MKEEKEEEEWPCVVVDDNDDLCCALRDTALTSLITLERSCTPSLPSVSLAHLQ